MTNEDLLKADRTFLQALDKQRRYVLDLVLVRMPCPNCAHLSNLVEAAGIAVNDYDFGNTKHTYRCPGCGRELREVVPLIAMPNPWYWGLVPIPPGEQSQEDRRSE